MPEHVYTIVVDTSKGEGPAKKLHKTLSDLEKQGHKVDKANVGLEKSTTRAGSAMSGMQKAAAALGVTFSVALVAKGIKAAITSFAEFETAMAEVSTLVDTSVTDMGELGDAVKEMAAQYGGSLPGQAQALYQIISAGASDSATAIETLDAANKLAIGGVTNMETAADGLTTILNAWGLEADDVTGISDAMFVAMKAGKTTIGELSGAIGAAAPIAAQLGVSYEEVLAATSALTKGGVTTSVAMNQLKAAMSAILKPTSEARDVAKDLGIEFNASALESKGFAGFLKDLTDKVGDDKEAMAKLFGSVEALGGVMALTGTQADDFAEILSNMKDRAGETDTAVEKMTDTLSFNWGKLQGEVAGLAASIGEGLAPAANAAVTGLTSLIGSLNNAIESGDNYNRMVVEAVEQTNTWTQRIFDLEHGVTVLTQSELEAFIAKTAIQIESLSVELNTARETQEALAAVMQNKLLKGFNDLTGGTERQEAQMYELQNVIRELENRIEILRRGYDVASGSLETYTSNTRDAADALSELNIAAQKASLAEANLTGKSNEKTDAVKKQTVAVKDDRTEAEKWADAIQTDAERAKEYSDKIDALTQRFKDNEIGSQQLQRELSDLRKEYEDVEKAIAETTLTTAEHVEQQKAQTKATTAHTQATKDYKNAHDDKNRSEEDQIENMADLIDKYIDSDTAIGKLIKSYKELKSVLGDLGELGNIFEDIFGTDGGGGGASDAAKTGAQIAANTFGKEFFGTLAGLFEGPGIGAGGWHVVSSGGVAAAETGGAALADGMASGFAQAWPAAAFVVGALAVDYLANAIGGPTVQEQMLEDWEEMWQTVAPQLAEPMNEAFQQINQDTSPFDWYRVTQEELERLQGVIEATNPAINSLVVATNEAGESILAVGAATQRAGKEFGATYSDVVNLDGELRVITGTGDNASEAFANFTAQVDAMSDGVVTAEEVARMYGVTVKKAEDIMYGATNAAGGLHDETERGGGIFDQTRERIEQLTEGHEANIDGMIMSQEEAQRLTDALNSIPDTSNTHTTYFRTEGPRPGDNDRHSGGPIERSGLYNLLAGEYVLSRQATQAITAGAVDRFNTNPRASMPGFNDSMIVATLQDIQMELQALRATVVYAA